VGDGAETGRTDWITRRRLLAQAAAASAATFVPWPGIADLQAPAGRGPKRGSLPLTFGAELEYYRSDPTHLEQRLALCAQAHYNTIQTYVPWNVHESSQGRLDFTGATSPLIVGDHLDEYLLETPLDEIEHGGVFSRVRANTDLEGFLHACVRHRMKVILRPGPFISDEWRNGGIPDWLLQQGYPEMDMRGPDGSTLSPGFPLAPPVANIVGGGAEYYFVGPSYGSDFYRSAVAAWLRAFARFAKPWLASAGGPVTTVQVDDEICFYYRFGPFEVDYHPSLIARFRKATGAEPPRGWPAQGGPVAALKPAFAWQRFKAVQLGQYLGFLRSELRAAGVRVPIVHEEELQLVPPGTLSELARNLDVLNAEFYNGDDGPWSLPLNELCAAAVRGAQSPDRAPIAAELGAGDDLLCYLLIGEGMHGTLAFTYTDGVIDGTVDAMSRIGRALHTAGARLARGKRRADTAVVWCPQLFHAPYNSTNFGFERDVRRIAERHLPALASLLIRAGLAFDLVDTDVATAASYRNYSTIWLVASDILPARAQADLVSYVEAGGKLICWPAPPTLDEHLDPCTTLAEKLFHEPIGAFYGDDAQLVEILGEQVPVWRGVQTFAPSQGARVVARRGSEACGYSRRRGRGEAILLGTWPAADLPAGAAGLVLELQQLPSSDGDAVAATRAAVARHFGPDAAAKARNLASGRRQYAVAPAGPAQYLVVYQFSNERRGGEVITGGAVGYWDGQNVVPTAELDTAENATTVSTPPFHPILPAHVAMVGALHRRAPAASVTDKRAQVRVIDGPGASTLSVINRYPEDISFAVSVRAGGRNVRLPEAGAMTLPAATGMLLPIQYELGSGGPRIAQATVQLLGYSVSGRRLELTVYSPRGGEVVIDLPGRFRSASVPARTSAHGGQIRVLTAPGERTLTVEWGRPAQAAGRSRTPRAARHDR